MSKLYIRLISDVHLEFRHNLHNDKKWEPLIPAIIDHSDYNPEIDSTCAILAGDIGHPSSPLYLEYLKRVKNRFDHVVVVSGNHESYSQHVKVDASRVTDPEYLPDRLNRSRHVNRISIGWSDRWIEDICQSHSIHYLQKGMITIKLKDDSYIKIAGATLWSDIPKHMEAQAEYGMNDFSHILDQDGKPLTAKKYREIHHDQASWLRNIIKSEDPQIIVTHHLPTSQLINPRYLGYSLNCCFSSDTFSNDILTRPTFWFSGHSHSANDITIQHDGRSCRFVLNPLGYPEEKSDYNDKLFFVLTGVQP